MGTMTYGLVRPNSQATAQKHDRRPICCGDYALQLQTPKGLTKVGVQSAQQCYRWELACEGGGMGLRAEFQQTEG